MRKHEGTSYIGSVEKRNHRTNAIYEKQGGFHPEARLDGRVLRRHNIVRLSDAALTLLLVEILKNERIIYLDAEKLAHPTAKTRERGLDYWRRFLSNGVMSATKMMKITGISNPSNKTSPHPLNAVFGASLATTAAAGIERLGGVDGAAGVTAREFLAQRDRYKFLLSVAAKLKLALQPEHEQVTAMRKVADGRP